MANQDTSTLTHAHKRMSHETIKRRQKLIPAALVLLAGSMLFQHILDPQVKQIHEFDKDLGTTSAGLNNEFMLLPLLGFAKRLPVCCGCAATSSSIRATTTRFCRLYA